jgi:hypothetical protein
MFRLESSRFLILSFGAGLALGLSAAKAVESGADAADVSASSPTVTEFDTASSTASSRSDTVNVATAPAVVGSTQTPQQMIARAYGVEKAHEIEALKFAFNVKQGGAVVRREWQWDVAENRVTYRGPGPAGGSIETTYLRDRLSEGDALLNKKVDEWFVNDQYWLLFPFHLVWDKTVRITREGNETMPIAPQQAEHLRVVYPEDSAKAGDVYDVYVDTNHLIKEWSYHPRGSVEPTYVTTWEDHAKAGPVLLSLNRQGRGADLRIWFDDVSVKANDAWHNAVRLDQLSRAEF